MWWVPGALVFCCSFLFFGVVSVCMFLCLLPCWGVLCFCGGCFGGVVGGVWFVWGLFWVVFWVFGGGFRLFLGLFFGIMVLGGFLGIWPCVESSLFPCQCVMHWGAFSSFWGSIINL